MKMLPPDRFASFEMEGYATRENAIRKLKMELQGVPLERMPVTLVAVNSKGRFVPVAVGQAAMALGLHFRGIAIVG